MSIILWTKDRNDIFYQSNASLESLLKTDDFSVGQSVYFGEYHPPSSRNTYPQMTNIQKYVITEEDIAAQEMQFINYSLEPIKYFGLVFRVPYEFISHEERYIATNADGSVFLYANAKPTKEESRYPLRSRWVCSDPNAFMMQLGRIKYMKFDWAESLKMVYDLYLSK